MDTLANNKQELTSKSVSEKALHSYLAAMDYCSRYSTSSIFYGILPPRSR